MKILDCDYIAAYDEKWDIQKKRILERYKKIYSHKYTDIKVIRVKTDTKGLRCYEVWGKEIN